MFSPYTPGSGARRHHLDTHLQAPEYVSVAVKPTITPHYGIYMSKMVYPLKQMRSKHEINGAPFAESGINQLSYMIGQIDGLTD